MIAFSPRCPGCSTSEYVRRSHMRVYDCLFRFLCLHPHRCTSCARRFTWRLGEKAIVASANRVQGGQGNGRCIHSRRLNLAEGLSAETQDDQTGSKPVSVCSDGAIRFPEVSG